MQPSTFLVIPGVYEAMEPLRSISNSEVKHSAGEDTLGVAPCENSSMPGLLLLKACFLDFRNRLFGFSLQTSKQIEKNYPFTQTTCLRVATTSTKSVC